MEFELTDVNATTPDVAYDREWALTLLKQVLHSLQEDCRKRGQIVAEPAMLEDELAALMNVF